MTTRFDSPFYRVGPRGGHFRSVWPDCLRQVGKLSSAGRSRADVPLFLRACPSRGRNPLLGNAKRGRLSVSAAGRKRERQKEGPKRRRVPVNNAKVVAI